MGTESLGLSGTSQLDTPNINQCRLPSHGKSLVLDTCSCLDVVELCRTTVLAGATRLQSEGKSGSGLTYSWSFRPTGRRIRLVT